MNKIKFNCTSTELDAVEMIVERFYSHSECEKLSLMMDIIATHCNGNPLKLHELKNANDFDFYHDVCGIMININRKTGKLENLFVPRYSV